MRLSLAIGLGLASIAASILLITADGIGGSIHSAHHAGASAAPLLLAAGAIASVSVAYPPPDGRHSFNRLVAALAFTAWGTAQLVPAPAAAAALNDVAILLFVIDAAYAVISDARTVRQPRRPPPAPAASKTPDLHDTGDVAQRLDLQSATASPKVKLCCTKTCELSGCATGQ